MILKRFNELTLDELYEIYKLRMEIFVVEQNCPYMDIDYLDKEAYHLMYLKNNELIAYLRIMFNDGYAKIGRVVSKYRMNGNGKELMLEAIKFIKENKFKRIEIAAQEYAIKFYESVGFKKYGDTFLMDDIPHVKMNLIME